MDHKYIEEHDIVARYELGRLSNEECVLFEQHFAHCSECQEEIEGAEHFRRALTQTVVKDGFEQLQTAEGRRREVPVARSWWPILATAAACILVFLLPAMLFVKHQRDLQAALQQRYETERQKSSALEKQINEANQKPQTNTATLEPLAASIFTLSLVRSADDSEPAKQITISRSQPWIILAVDQDEIGNFERYRFTLQDPAGKTVWTKSDIPRAHNQMLGITLPSSLFRAGNFVLVIDGFSAKTGYVNAGRYSFRVKM